MKISLEWLSEYLPGAIDAQASADALLRGGLPVESIQPHEQDTVLDVEVTSNRGDCLCHIGIARELAALMRRELHTVAPTANEAATSAHSVTSVRIDAPELCPHYTARVLRNVRVEPSPKWLSRRLEAVGLRSINNIVDVTNYVMFEMGQPLHAFDFDKLEGRQIIVRTAGSGERLTSIDGHVRSLSPGMLVIADRARPVALAGVMGGLDSQVTERTTSVLLESARFDPLSVRRTARALDMRSESSYRFERGIDPTLPARASLRAAQLMLETAGGELLEGMAEAGSGEFTPRSVTLRLARLNALLGIELPIDEVSDALAHLGLSPQRNDGQIICQIPSWRRDLNIEVDLIEEAARVIGYDRVPVQETISIRVNPPDEKAAAMTLIRTIMAAAGYFEAITFSFVSDVLAEDFVPPEAAGLPRAAANVRKADARLRPSLLPGLLEAIRRNETNGTPDARLFEIGSTFWISKDGQVDERRRLGIAGAQDLRDLRGAVEELLLRLNSARPITVVPEDRPGYAQGTSGRLEWANQTIGHLGLIEHSIASKLDLREKTAGAELELDALLAGFQPVPQLKAMPKYPSIRRDLTLDVAEQTRYSDIESLIWRVNPAFLEDVEYVTTYRGKQLASGQKSVTLTLVYRSPATTLTSEQVDASYQQIVQAAQRELSATLRS